MKTIEELRKEFELNEEISIHLKHGNIQWDDIKMKYFSEFLSLHIVACYVNGAWWMFQELNK